MNNSYNYLFLYLKDEKINIDKEDFLFQVQSHPDFPSLLSISDTLDFLNVKNEALKIDSSNIELLPENFIALIQDDKNTDRLCYVKKVNNSYLLNFDNGLVLKNIEKTDLESRWKSVVLLIEKLETENYKSGSKSKAIFIKTLFILIILNFISIISFFSLDLFIYLFIFSSSFGLFFSVLALKDFFGIKQNFVNKFCNISSSTDCDLIIKSTKWKIFDYLSFGDLSIVFFTIQLIGLSMFLIKGDIYSFWIIQKVLLYCCIPIIIMSLYFQKYVEKKWCPLCLIIISFLVCEMIITFKFVDVEVQSLSNISILIFTLVFFITLFSWLLLKNILIRQKELTETQLKLNRFARNYNIFKKILISGSKIIYPNIMPIIIGNKNSKTTITIISNPFCIYCEEVHYLINNILEKHYNNLKIELILKVDFDNETEQNKFFFSCLLNQYNIKGEKSFIDALDFWYSKKNVLEWLDKYLIENNDIDNIGLIFTNNFQWCNNNGFNYTPNIFINGYEYPRNFERNNLYYYINDIIEDTF